VTIFCLTRTVFRTSWLSRFMARSRRPPGSTRIFRRSLPEETVMIPSCPLSCKGLEDVR